MQGIKIKPLVWVDFADRGAKAQAWNEANYMIQKWSDGQWELSASYPGCSTSIYGTDLFHSTIEAAKAAAQADYEARIRSALTVQPSPDVAAQFDNADWYWRTMDPDDCGDSPEEAVNRGMLGRFCVCEIASSYDGPTRYGFIAPVLDPESDDEEFVHFDTHEDAIEAAKARAALAREKGGEA